MNARPDWYIAIKELRSTVIMRIIGIWLYVRVYVYTYGFQLTMYNCD